RAARHGRGELVLAGVAVHRFDSHHDGRDVVQPAARVRLGDHPVYPVLRAALGGEDAVELLVLQHPGEAVRGEQQDVALFQTAEVDVGHDVATGPDTAGDHVAVGVDAGLVRGEQSG